MPPKKSARRPQPARPPRPATPPDDKPAVQATDATEEISGESTTTVVAADAAKTEAAAPPAATTTAPPRRQLARVKPGSPSTRTARRAEFAPLESDDAAIPIDRVPYVPSDLRRVAAIALLMFLLIIVGGYLISQQVH